jgi:hypothetical protein
MIIYLVLWGGVRLSPLGTAATTGLLYQPQMTDDECGAVGGIRLAGEIEILEETLFQ